METHLDEAQLKPLRSKMIRETELFLERHLHNDEQRWLPYRQLDNQLTHSGNTLTAPVHFNRIVLLTGGRLLRGT